jgi:hypothetical protein
MNDTMKWILFFVLLFVAIVAINKLFKAGSAVGDVVGGVTDAIGDTAHAYGLGQSDDTKKLKTLNAFKPSFYKSLTGAQVLLMTRSGAEKMAKIIYDAVTLGGLYCDDNAILGVFKSLRTQSQVSFLADVFFAKYGKDMLTYFYSPMTDSHLKTLYAIVSDMPVKSI